MTKNSKKLNQLDYNLIENEIIGNIEFIETLLNNYYGDTQEIKKTAEMFGLSYDESFKQRKIVFQILFEILTKQIFYEALK